MASSSTRRRKPVYPRPRGGTCPAFVWIERSVGLSPPTRGNPVPESTRPKFSWSIPAHAGEPCCRIRMKSACWVYPRPRGGTRSGFSNASSRGGLSPPTRGNHSRIPRRAATMRSIPAHAGEPCPLFSLQRVYKVYPRPRGGTSNSLPALAANRGLSPPTRGNQYQRPGRQGGYGSIPAHAGEPLIS